VIGYVDTHCHLDRYPSPIQVWRDAVVAEVVTVAVTELPSSFRLLATRFGRREGLRVAIGFHPLRVVSSAPSELQLFRRHLSLTDYVGEVGLDFSERGRASRKQQITLFEGLLDEPAIGRKVVSVHTRRADRPAIERLATARINGILHWYTGPLGLIDQALSAGLYFSINPAMLQSAHGRRVIAAIPADRVLTETDGPYTRTDGRPSQPADVPALVDHLARTWNAHQADARQQIWNNMADLFRRATRQASGPSGRNEARGASGPAG
jgi:TatD DNase family protein